MSQTPRAKCYENADFWCPPGWRRIVDALGTQLTSLRVDVGQVKEKFGDLRVYLSSIPANSAKTAERLIWMAEDLASVTCQECGQSPATKETIDGRVMRVCRDHGEFRC